MFLLPLGEKQNYILSEAGNYISFFLREEIKPLLTAGQPLTTPSSYPQEQIMVKPKEG